MPSNAHCCVPGCTNRRSACKWGLVPDGSGGFTKRRLCGSNDVGGCKNTADCCRSLSFHRLPSQKKTLKEWIVRIRRVNLPVNSNSRVCGVHFSNKRTTEATSPDLFLWTKCPQKRTTRSAHLAAVADLPQEEVRQSPSRLDDQLASDQTMPGVQSNDTGRMLSSPVTVEDGGSTGKAEATQRGRQSLRAQAEACCY